MRERGCLAVAGLGRRWRAVGENGRGWVDLARAKCEERIARNELTRTGTDSRGRGCEMGISHQPVSHQPARRGAERKHGDRRHETEKSAKKVLSGVPGGGS